jgi:Carboxypeptidase regulatory-like domain/TonB dependent receptor
MTKRWTIAALLIIGFCVMTSWVPAYGQAVYGSILGTVTDPQGAAVVGAKVTVTNQRKGTTDESTTNESGNYSVTHLVPDVYTVRVEGAGFKASELKDIAVAADQGARVDMALVLGGTSETVEVTGEAPELKTDRADVATSFNEKYVEDVPILNRNFTTLQLLAPGSQKLVGWSHAATENPQGSQQIFTQGQHFSGTAFELDGTDNQDPILGIIVVNPNLDAVTEAKVALQNYDAEFGKAVSSVVTAQTKSGSNDIHGSGFWYRRTDALEARDPFTEYQKNPTTGRFIPQSKWQQFGGSVGGPIIKDKLFFFGDYQATRQTNGVTGIFTVPTNKARTSCNPATNTTGFCDLSDYIGIQGPGTGLIYNPNSGAIGGTGRTQFAGNLIPIGMISAPAAAILAAFPAPQNGNVQNNYVASGSGPYNQNAFDVRIDSSLTPTINLFGRFSLDYFSLSGKGLLGALGGPGNGLLGLAGSSNVHNYSVASGVTKTFSSSLLADFRFGYFKYNPQTSKPDSGSPMTAFGIPNANTSDPKTSGLGAFLLGPDPISGENGAPNSGGAGAIISSFGDGLGVARCNCPLTESEQEFQFVNNWTKIKGNHQIKFGADLRYAMNLRIPSDNNRTGEYNFSPEGTSNNGTDGLDLATFLLGDVTSFARYVNNPNLPSANDAAERQWRTFFYGQDTWRATPKLTVNYGLRWEIYFPQTVNAKGNGGWANIVDLGGQGAVRVGGYGPYGLNGNIENNFKAFAPRLGIAYSVNPKTVVRAGYGRSYDIGVFGSNFGHTVTQNLPVLLKQNLDATALIAGASSNITPLFQLKNGPIAPAFPAIPSNGLLPFCSPNAAGACAPGSLGAAQVPGVHILPIRQTLPTVDSWNVSMQGQVTNTISVEAAYVGSKGTHGFVGNGPNYDVNPVSMYLYGVTDPNSTSTPKSNYSQNARRPLCGLDFATSQCTKIPFDLGNYYGNDAASQYNAFELKVEKRFSGGLQFLTHYTFSHAQGYESDDSYYAINHGIAWGPVDFNRKQVWVANIVYELPFGKGKQFMGGVSKAANYAVGGWQLSNTTNWSSGLPWTPSFNECGAEEDVGVCRPNRGTSSFPMGVGSFHTPPGGQPYIQYFSPVPNITTTSSGPFLDPGKGNLGNYGHASLWGPAGFYSDLSVSKNFPITERVALRFQMDAFNVFNHPVYAFSQNNGATSCIDCQGGTTGQILDIENGTNMRQIQFALRLQF